MLSYCDVVNSIPYYGIFFSKMTFVLHCMFMLLCELLFFEE